MEITSTFEVQNCDVYFSLESIFFVNQSASVEFFIDSELFVDAQYAYGYADFPAFSSFGADETFINKGIGYADFPAFTSTGMADIYTPPQPGAGYAIFPPFSSVGFGVDIGIGTGSASLPAFVSKGGDYEYGEGYGNFPAFTSFGLEGTMANEITLFSVMRAISDTDMAKETVIFLYSNGQFASTFTGTRQAVATLMSNLQGSSVFSVIGEFNVSLMSALAAGSYLTGEVNGAPPLNNSSRVWVVNMETGASGQYDNYGFTDFFTDPDTGKNYGIADDGIYLLEGDDDNGADINALIDGGKSDLGTASKKKIINVYAGVSSSGKMLLKVNADGQEYIYEARSSSTDMKNHRFDIGKGLSGNYYNLVSMNQNGDDFDLETIHFEPVTLSRKI